MFVSVAWPCAEREKGNRTRGAVRGRGMPIYLCPSSKPPPPKKQERTNCPHRFDCLRSDCFLGVPFVCFVVALLFEIYTPVRRATSPPKTPRSIPFTLTAQATLTSTHSHAHTQHRHVTTTLLVGPRFSQTCWFLRYVQQPSLSAFLSPSALYHQLTQHPLPSSLLHSLLHSLPYSSPRSSSFSSSPIACTPRLSSPTPLAFGTAS